MPNALVTNEPSERASYLKALRKVAQRASFLDIAVSYVKMGGWKHLAKLIQQARMPVEQVRLLVTDQFLITQPHALDAAIKQGITLRKYVGNRVFHPKVYLARDESGQPTSAL